MKNKQAISQGQNPNDELTKKNFLFWCQVIYSWCDLYFQPVTGSAKRIRGLELSFHYFLMNIGKTASFTPGLWLQHNCQVIVKEMRSAEAELRELWNHMGHRGKWYDSDIKHMAVHLQVALARFPSLEKALHFKRATLQRELSKAVLLQQVVQGNGSLGFNLSVSTDWVTETNLVFRILQTFSPASHAFDRAASNSSGTTLQPCQDPTATNIQAAKSST